MFIQEKCVFSSIHIKKIAAVFAALALVAMTLAGAAACSKASVTVNGSAVSTSFPVTITDDLGRAVKLSKVPQRIVSMAPSNTEILFALGVGSKVVGVDNYSDYPAAAKTLPQVGSAFPSFSIETILSLKPDLAVAFGYTLPDYVSQLENLGIPVAVMAPKDVNGVINIVGLLTGSSAQAKQVTGDMQQRLTTVENKLKGAASPRVFWEFDGTDPASPWTAGPGSFNDALITLAGGQDIGASGPTSSWQMSGEAIIKADPSPAWPSGRAGQP
jgi:cobalamin transport system substrate-binding protein